MYTDEWLHAAAKKAQVRKKTRHHNLGHMHFINRLAKAAAVLVSFFFVFLFMMSVVHMLNTLTRYFLVLLDEV